MTVSEFLKSTDHPMKKELKVMYDHICASAPVLTQHVKWNAPSFYHNGVDLITFNLSKKNAILLIFHRGAKAKKIDSKKPLLERNAQLLAWPAPDRGVLTIKGMDDYEKMKSSIKQLVNDWIKVAAEHA
jgi:hypothetical protein